MKLGTLIRIALYFPANADEEYEIGWGAHSFWLSRKAVFESLAGFLSDADIEAGRRIFAVCKEWDKRIETHIAFTGGWRGSIRFVADKDKAYFALFEEGERFGEYVCLGKIVCFHESR
jgi:hypothetical protein